MDGAPRTRFVGDTKQARTYAWFLTFAAVVPPAVVAVFVLGWYRAQVYGWTEGFRSYHAGDPFPWGWVAVGVLGCVFLGRFAVRQWRRYRALVADDRRRGVRPS